MKIRKFKLLGEYFQAYSSDAYKETLRAFEHLASASLLLLDRKPEEERGEILARAQHVTEKLTDMVDNETPMVGALALLTAVRVHEALIREKANNKSS